jgi:hypothetical protein
MKIHSESEGIDLIWQMVSISFNWITRQDSCAQLILEDCNISAGLSRHEYLDVL